MIRTFFAIFIGLLTWIATQTALLALLWYGLPGYFSFALTDDWRLLSFLLIMNIIISVVSSYTTASISSQQRIQHSLMMGTLVFAFVLYLVVSLWDFLPGWFLIFFLALVIPCSLIGADLRNRQKDPLSA